MGLVSISERLSLGFGGKGQSFGMPELYLSIGLIYPLMLAFCNSEEALAAQSWSAPRDRNTGKYSTPGVPEVLHHLGQMRLHKLQGPFDVMEGGLREG